MEWLSSIKKTISYIESHLLEIENTSQISKEVGISLMYLQQGFQIMTGYSIKEYIRNRRLYEAALDIKNNNVKIIDVALKYGYDSNESFTKAFYRFHGINPSKCKKNDKDIKTFLPLKITISINGGDKMEYNVKKLSGFKVIGFEESFKGETSYQEIPKFWDEFYKKYPISYNKQEPTNNIEKAILDNHIGEFGICIDSETDKENFKYLIAGKYEGKEVPKGLIVKELPTSLYAIFPCVGPLPKALQDVNTRIYKEWLPGNDKYELNGCLDIEWYSQGSPDKEDYRSEIWLPIKEK